MEIIKAGSLENWKKNAIRISLALNCHCNFSCSYCTMKNIRDNKELRKKQLDLDILKVFLKDIFSLNYDNYHFSLASGEPTLYKNLKEFYSYINMCCGEQETSIGLITNGSNFDRISSCIELAPNIKHKIAVSIHEEQRSIEQYKEQILKFKYPNLLNIIFLLQPSRLEAAFNIQNFAKEIGASFTLQTLTFEGKIHPDYNDDEIELLKSHGPKDRFFVEYTEEPYIQHFTKTEYSQNNNLINYKDMYCSAGYGSLSITNTAKVYRCFYDRTGVNFSLENNSILDYPNLLKIKPCSIDRCTCVGLIKLPKWKKGTPPPHYIKTN